MFDGLVLVPERNESSDDLNKRPSPTQQVNQTIPDTTFSSENGLGPLHNDLPMVVEFGNDTVIKSNIAQNKKEENGDDSKW